MVSFLHPTGLVTDLRDVHVSGVALGKAHALALTNKGQVFSFGINNKGQCGRDFTPQTKEGTGVYCPLCCLDSSPLCITIAKLIELIPQNSVVV